MFEYESETKGFSGALFLAQLLLVPLFSLIVAIVGAVLFMPFEQWIGEVAVEVMGSILGGFALGCFVAYDSPAIKESGGLFAWAIPVIIFGAALIDELTRTGSAAVLFVGRPANISPLFTVTAFAAISYSLGVYVVRRRKEAPSIR